MRLEHSRLAKKISHLRIKGRKKVTDSRQVLDEREDDVSQNNQLMSENNRLMMENDKLLKQNCQLIKNTKKAEMLFRETLKVK